MTSVGKSARALREQLGLSQKEAAAQLGISNVHLCNLEKDNSHPSPELQARYRELWGVDLYVFAWCRDGDADHLPKQLRAAAKSLAAGWQQLIDEQITKRHMPRR